MQAFTDKQIVEIWNDNISNALSDCHAAQVNAIEVIQRYIADMQGLPKHQLATLAGIRKARIHAKEVIRNCDKAIAEMEKEQTLFTLRKVQ